MHYSIFIKNMKAKLPHKSVYLLLLVLSIILIATIFKFTYKDKDVLGDASQKVDAIAANISDIDEEKKNEIIAEKVNSGEIKQVTVNKAQEMLSGEVAYDYNSLVVFPSDNNSKPEKLVLNPEKSEILDPNTATVEDKVLLELSLIELLEEKEIQVVQPNYIYDIAWSTSGDTDTPNDFSLPASTGKHWYYEKENLRQLWQDLECADGGSSCGGSSDITVAVIDTGLAYEDRTSYFGDTFKANDDLFTDTASINLYINEDENKNNRKDNDGNGIYNDKNGFSAQVYVDCLSTSCTSTRRLEEGHPNDDNGHGTYVTGLIASLVNNNSHSVSPAFNVSIMPIKANIAHSGSFSSLTLWYAIDYAVDNGANVINMSLAGTISDCTTGDPALNSILSVAASNDVLVLAATGNSGSSANYYPACSPHVMGVGSVDSNGSRSSYSNYGSQNVDIVAYVGDGSPSPSYSWQRGYYCGISCSSSVNNFTSFANWSESGTSFASPQVAGLAAIIYSIDPTLTKAEVVSYLENNADDTVGPSIGSDTETGAGAIDFEASFNAAANDNTTPSIAIVEPNGSGDNADETFLITWTDSDIDNDAEVNLYWDNDTNFANGAILINECSGISENDGTDSCTANSQVIPSGSVYVHGCIKDFAHASVCNVSSGPITVSHSVLRDFGKTSVKTTWKTVNFDTTFTSPPAITAEISTENGGSTAYLSFRNVTTTGFDIRLNENIHHGGNDLHQIEIVSWYASQNSDSDELIGFIDLNSENLPSDWVAVDFYSNFSTAPQVHASQITNLGSGNAVSYADIRNVTTSGFEIRLEEPDGFNGLHVYESYNWIAFESIPESGGTGVNSTDEAWKTTSLSGSYAVPPIIIANIQTENGLAPAIVDIKNVTNTSFQFRIEEERDGIHANETIVWTEFEYVPPQNESNESTINHNWENIAFSKPFTTVPLVFAEITTENGTDTAEVDLKNISNYGFTMRIEEDTNGWDGYHAFEDVSWYAIGNLQTEELAGTLNINDSISCVPFGTTYGSIPTVFANIQSEVGSGAAEIDIVSISTSNFCLRIEEDKGLGWNDLHPIETVAWYAFETHPSRCYGTLDASNTTNSWNNTINFSTGNGTCNFSETPHLLAEINSENGGQTVQLDIRLLSSSSFQIRLEEEIGYEGNHVSETIRWLAWE